jgi:hypothetical protein
VIVAANPMRRAMPTSRMIIASFPITLISAGLGDDFVEVA